MSKTTKTKIRLSKQLTAATGKIDYTLKNNYMFHITLQKNNTVLKGLIGALLHLRQDEILEVRILNPILPCERIDYKEFILDIYILLNNKTSINLELQIENEGNWPNRSLIYLCRSFDNLNRGSDYSEIQPSIHIGILDFTLFPDSPEFYSQNMLMNINNHKIFNDKFRLNVLSLKQIKLATEEDRFWEINKWAELFQATTWEEIKMLAQNNDILKEAAETIYENNSDQIIRWQCQAREDYENKERARKKQMKELKKALAEKDSALAESKSVIAEKETELAAKETELAKKETELAEINKRIAELEALALLHKN